MLAALAGLVALCACGTQAPDVTSAPSPESSAGGSSEVSLPAADRMLPGGVVGATPWLRMSSHPSGFDPGLAHPDYTDLADAFGAAIAAGYAGSPTRPELDLDLLDEDADGAILLISETGVGDDSVAGTQYVLVVMRDDRGWTLDELWTRALCRRGVSGDRCV